MGFCLGGCFPGSPQTGQCQPQSLVYWGCTMCHHTQQEVLRQNWCLSEQASAETAKQKDPALEAGSTGGKRPRTEKAPSWCKGQVDTLGPF